MSEKAIGNALELKLRRCKGDELQKFLAKLMQKLHGDNFQAGGTDYSHGDLKCDGLLLDPLTIFACYGPVNSGDHTSESTMRKAVQKVRSDFEGAKGHWPDMKAWTFVTNYLETPTQIVREILALRAENPGLEILMHGKAVFERHVSNMPPEDVKDLIGEAATEADFMALQPSEVMAVVKALVGLPQSFDLNDHKPVKVPFEKMEFNDLAQVYRDRILMGFRNQKEVERLLIDDPNPLLAGDLASMYKHKYQELDAQGLSSGDVMDELYRFTVAGERMSVPRDVAIWSVLAYFFEKCTIFKDKPPTPLADAA